jgi:protein TonB
MTNAARNFSRYRGNSGRTLVIAAGISLLLHGSVLAFTEKFWKSTQPKLPTVMAVSLVAAPKAPGPVTDTPKQTASIKPIQPKKGTKKAAVKPVSKNKISTKVTKKKALKKKAAKGNVAKKTTLKTLPASLKPVEKIAIIRQSPEHVAKPQLASYSSNSLSVSPGLDQVQKANRAIISDQATVPLFSGVSLSNAPPQYPWLSRRQGEEGRVLLDVQVTKDGRAKIIRIKQSRGHDRLDEAAQNAVQAWRFIAAQTAGMTRPGRTDVPIVFRLTD